MSDLYDEIASELPLICCHRASKRQHVEREDCNCEQANRDRAAALFRSAFHVAKMRFETAVLIEGTTDVVTYRVTGNPGEVVVSWADLLKVCGRRQPV